MQPEPPLVRRAGMIHVKRTAVLAAFLALAACGDVVEEQADRQGNRIAADLNRATQNVADSVDRLGDTMANEAGYGASRAIDDAADRTKEAADRLADETRRHADRARDDAGRALEDAGRDVRER